jgi:hypothetical protein
LNYFVSIMLLLVAGIFGRALPLTHLVNKAGASGIPEGVLPEPEGCLSGAYPNRTSGPGTAGLNLLKPFPFYFRIFIQKFGESASELMS